MNPDMQVLDPDTRAAVFLRAERFALVTHILGAQTDVARGQLLGMDPKTIWRARSRWVCGEEFIAATLAVLERNKDKLAEFGIKPTFEEVFELGPKQSAA